MDVNTSAIKRRNEISAGLDSENYEKVFGACNALNALLPESVQPDGRQKYRITISDILYKKYTHHEVIVTCTECEKQFEFSKIKIFVLIAPVLIHGLNGHNKEKMWICTECKKEIKLRETNMTERTIREPYYIRVVPKPPQHTDGILDRESYRRKVTKWAWQFVGEWEASMAQFRDDNWQKKDEMYIGEDNEMEDGGEDADQ